MKSILFFGAFLLCMSAFSQDDYDKRLLSKFSEEQIAKLQENESSALDYWTYYLDHSYIITDVPVNKSAEGFEILKIKELNSFNILDHNLTMDRNTKRYFQIKGSEKILILLSNKEFVEDYNTHRQIN